MSRVSDMHEVDGLAHILLLALVAGHQVHTVLRFASKCVSNSVTEASEVTLEPVTLLQLGAEQAVSPTATMLVPKTPRRGPVTGVIIWEFPQAGPYQDLFEVSVADRWWVR